MLRRTFLGGATAAVAAPFLPVRPALAQGDRARVLRFVPQSDLTIVDPVTTTAYITRNHALMVFDQLYGLDAQLTPQPQMVEGHTVEDDGKRWTFRLRDGLKFHDGEPVRSRDCIASIRRWAQRDSLGQALMARTDALEAPDDRTFVIRLKRPYGLMLETLAKLGPPVLVIMPERLAANDPAQQIPEVIGSGPFRFNTKERLVGARAVYDRNPDYRPRADGAVSWVAGPKRVHFDRVEWQVMPDPGTAAAALQNGEVDWWENPISDLVPTLQASPEITTQLASTLGNLGTGVMNHLYPPFDNPTIRRVVLEALSQADFMGAAAGDDPKLWRKDVGLFTPGTAMATDAGLSVLTGPRDLAKAKRDLVAAGYKGERVVLMSTSENPVLGALGEVMNDLLRRLGMNVQYVVSDWGTLVTRRASKAPPDQGGWNIFNTTWTGLDMANPVVEQVLRCGGEKGFFGWPNLPELESLREAWIEAPDQAVRQAIAARMQPWRCATCRICRPASISTGRLSGATFGTWSTASSSSGTLVASDGRSVPDTRRRSGDGPLPRGKRASLSARSRRPISENTQSQSDCRLGH